MDIIAELTSIVGADAVLNAADDMAPFLSDWHSRFAGQAHAVVLPQTTAQETRTTSRSTSQEGTPGRGSEQGLPATVSMGG